MIELQAFLDTSSAQFHLFLISFIFVITWIYTLNPKWSFVIDDIDGVARFADRFSSRRDEKGELIEEKIDYYEQDVDGKKTRYKNFQLNPSIGFPGCFMRWFRTNWGRQYKVIGTNSKGHKVYGFQQVAWKHHLLNLIVQYANAILAYFFLAKLFNPKLALFTALIFSVHPICVQVTAWISGVGYAFSMLGTLIALNLALNIADLHYLIPCVGAASAFSTLMLLPGSFTWIILLMIGKIHAGIIYLIVGSLILIRQAITVTRYRKKAFKDQQMGRSTYLYVRKIFVMVKTVWYYFKMMVFPKRLGLFHTFGYHFEDPLNYANREFWLGALSLLGCGIWFYFAPFPVRLGLIWFFVYLSIFTNFITAMQVVSERYIFMPSFGFALIVGYYLQDYSVILALLLGIYIMRVWVHLPTYANEVRFYESNVFNFPDSEVAMGNLGVSYLNHGMPHKAMDVWFEATRQNPNYDVPWYNLYSIFKQNGDIISARNYLKRCLDAETIHFPDQWKKELEEIDKIIAQAISDGRIVQAPQAMPPQRPPIITPPPPPST